MADYDAIVIGAGFGGLGAALRLAERGARVLVLERREPGPWRRIVDAWAVHTQ